VQPKKRKIGETENDKRPTEWHGKEEAADVSRMCPLKRMCSPLHCTEKERVVDVDVLALECVSL
jgi:hypothetical protein